jgi:two-component system phosphate regulon response regulator PhoB
MTFGSVEVKPFVLVAEDDEDILELVALLLEERGYEIARAGDGQEALGLISARPPDLAVLDVRMPKLDGFEVSRRIRANDDTQEVPVILLTALAREEDVAVGIDAGATDYVKKPFSPDELVTRIEAILGR